MNFTFDTKIDDIIHLNEFSRFGSFLFPMQWGYSKELRLKDVDRLLPYHSCIDKNTTLNVIKNIYERNMNQSYFFNNIYTKEEMENDPSKKETGLFYFKGKPNYPFAILCAGGGFSYVGSIHESFPHAIELSKRGYNAFVLHYRLGDATLACQDLAKAISYIFQYHQSLQLSLSCYSLWGGSAGARMAAYLGSLGTEPFIYEKYPKAGCIIMQYTGHSHCTQYDPPTYACVGLNDIIASWRVMKNRISKLQSFEIDTEFHIYKNLGHGFGLGLNTSADHWIDDAIAFWDKQIKKEINVYE